MTDIVKFITTRLDEQAAALVEYVEKRQKAKTADALSRQFMTSSSLQSILSPYEAARFPRFLAPYELDAVVWLDADIAAKRMILAEFNPAPREPETDAELHARCAHPAWEYETTEGQRKAWERADEPPEGEGWERNREEGRDGWERLEYTEESYWRRLRPGGPEPVHVPMILRLLALPYATHPEYAPSWRP